MALGVTTELGKHSWMRLWEARGGLLPGSDLKSLFLKVGYVLCKLGSIQNKVKISNENGYEKVRALW